MKVRTVVFIGKEKKCPHCAPPTPTGLSQSHQKLGIDHESFSLSFFLSFFLVWIANLDSLGYNFSWFFSAQTARQMEEEGNAGGREGRCSVFAPPPGLVLSSPFLLANSSARSRTLVIIPPDAVSNRSYLFSLQGAGRTPEPRCAQPSKAVQPWSFMLQSQNLENVILAVCHIPKIWGEGHESMP